MSVLTVDNITVGYGKRLILENQSIVFDKPEITGTIAAKSLVLYSPWLTLDCGAASELNRLFSIVMFSAPLCGVKCVRVEVQNVGNILLR